MTCIKEEVSDALIERMRDFCQRHKKWILKFNQ